MKDVARIIAGLAILAGIVYALHWLGSLTFAHAFSVERVPPAGVELYILTTLWGLCSGLAGAMGIAIGLALAYGLGGLIIKEKRDPEDPMKTGITQWKDDNISPYDTPRR